MTPQQEQTVKEFIDLMHSQIKKYFEWRSEGQLNVIYFKEADFVYLQSIVPNGISNDYAGMYVARNYFKIDSKGTCFVIPDQVFQEKRELATEVIRVNPNG